MTRATPLAREAGLSAAAAGALAAALLWLGPPGADLASHAYQRTLFLHHGFALWNNFWYAGRYSFVTYSVLYYPVAALLGIRLLALATISTAALAFAVVLWREWGPATRWSSRTFAVVWAGVVLSAAFPFALGAALGLLAVWAAQARRLWGFALLAALTLAASPLAFLLLALLLAGFGIARRREGRALLAPALTLGAFGLVEVALWRAFPGGRYPFSWPELTAVVAFCVIGAVLTWRVDQARTLRWTFVVYLAACLAVFLVPTAVGENVARVRYAAVPLAVLTLSLRCWKPLPVCLGVLALAVSWNVTPIAGSYLKGRADPAASSAYWAPAISFLRAHLTPSYRVEAVDTTGHWEAVYLAEAGIPLARGGYRQDDFPQNELLYDDLTPVSYRAWLRRLGVRYVVLTSAPVDYSSRGEAELLRSGLSGLRQVFARRRVKIFELPRSRPILTGPAGARVLRLTATRVVLDLPRAGRYRLAVRYSPYRSAARACLIRRLDGMTTVSARRGGRFDLRFHVSAASALASALAGEQRQVCDSG